ncbi:hypothetical protein [Paenibacillus oryzisoli]|uniref:Replication-associated protein G2P N-terminal domain-containing protein n=1 Tax=Paenibacillus oryzisoli TaxID=1850517 RepID=A0A198ACL2_9BACL|nr:hypothetical protein [Paenibacillus oryzisoli]OAS18907.1 hypothetical protein A8708_32170 [Paenibacillus oryzisoli]
MFDTIKLKANNIYIDDSVFEKLVDKVESITYLDRTTGEINVVYKLKDEKIPYLVYNSRSLILSLQLSIPKFLFGNNIQMVGQEDVANFFKKLRNHLYNLLHIDVDPSEWTITSRVDVCWNFQVGSNVSDYIMQLAKRRMPYKNTNVYNHNETVIFGNKSSRIMFYDKAKQCINDKESNDTIKQAEGILRLEVSPSDADIRKFSPKKRAVELLTREFFEHITKPILEGITFQNIDNELTLDWLKQQKSISNAETILGFRMISETFGEFVLKELYSPKTLQSRKHMIEQLQFPRANNLMELEIDFPKQVVNGAVFNL